MTAPAPLLEATGLAKSFGGVEAVRNVSLSVSAGEILALIGPNGAGKSTCFNMLNGQIRPDRGSIRLDGAEVAGLGPRQMWRLGVGRTFQIASTFGSMSVRENVQVAMLAAARRAWRPLGKAGAALRQEADWLLGQVGLGPQWYRPCAELAYGDVKRLELAMALTSEPSLLLMDEPAAGMAAGERLAMMQFVSGVAKERSIGILFTEHDMDSVFRHADRVVVLDRGEVIAEGSPAAVRGDPRVRAIYLGGGLGAPEPGTASA